MIGTEGVAYVAKTKTKENTLDAALYLRVASEDMQRLDALAERLPIASRNAIAREAMRLGLALLEEDPARLLVRSTKPRRRR